MSKSIRWGILGYARIARMSLIPAIARAGNAQLLAIASRDAGKLDQAIQAHNIPRGYDSYESLLADDEIDAVYIPLPNALHREWAIRAMQAGKHVLCEKPLALHAAQVRDMIAAARHNHVLLMEAFMYRHGARLAAVREIIGSGALGDLRHISASFRFLLDRDNTIKMKPELGGGAFYDVGCYPINLLGAITGKLPIAVSTSATLDQGVDVNASALLHYDNGLIAALHCGFNAFGRNAAEFIGTQGMLEVNDMFGESAGELKLTTREGVRNIPVPACDRYGDQVRDFSAAILEGRAPIMPLDESLMNAEVMDQILASIHTQARPA